MGELPHRHEIRERLGRMRLIREAVVDGHPGEFGKRSRRLLAVATKLNGVVHATEHTCRILHRFLVSDLAPARTEVGDVGALVIGRYLEPGACAGRILLEDERNVPPLEPRLLAAGQLGGLQLCSKTQQKPNLRCGQVIDAQQAPAFEVDWHGRSPGSGDLTAAWAGLGLPPSMRLDKCIKAPSEFGCPGLGELVAGTSNRLFDRHKASDVAG